MKKIFLPCLICLISSFAFAQSTTITGTVNDQQGKPVAFAFIKDAKHNYATYSDAYGSFGLKVDSLSRILVSANNYKEAVVKIENPQSVNVVLTAGGESSAGFANSPDAFKTQESKVDMTAGSLTMKGSGKEDTHGSRFFFDVWVHGFAISTADTIYQNNNYRFNYEKIDGNVLYTEDGQTIRQITNSEVKGFTLFDDAGKSYVFESVPAIDPKHFVELLASGSKYKIYKVIGTKFVQANYQTNGITSSGNNYDEYVDESTYYAVKVPGGAPQKFTLRGKSLKTTFAPDVAKVSKYLSDHDTDINDDYLRALGDYLNN